MAIEDLKHQISRLPEQPGVYVYLDAGGQTLYVGKASHLRDRVGSYLNARGTSPRHDLLLDAAARLEVIVTDSVSEALMLEANLIKQRHPRFNIMLRDDKHYPFLVLTVAEPCPRVLVARRVERDGNVYAGPYMPSSLARRTMQLTHRVLGIRSCNEKIDGQRDRPCLEYDIGRCLAPCVAAICSDAAYATAVEKTRLLLGGRTGELVEQLTAEMTAAAAREAYEQAAHLRDGIRTLEALRGRQQKMATPAAGDRDAFGVKTGPSGTVLQVFLVRRGRVIDRVELMADAESAGAPESDVLGAAISQFYEDREVPPEIHVAHVPDDRDALEAWLGARAGRQVAIVVPRGPDRRGLLDLATRNASMAYQSRFSGGAAANYEALEQLREILGLASFPRRIECFDISTLQGAETVASMVVCEDGRMRRSDYRKFRVRTSIQPGGREKPDDFAAMHEVVQRRYQKILALGGPFPDLIVIDGGKGQLEAAYAALESLGLSNLVAVGLAKKEELVVTRDRPEPIALPVNHPSLLLLQRIRDEAHRVAVTFHRNARTARDLRSELDDIRGIGPRRRRALLEAFGSVSGVRRASREDLSAVVGTKAADAVLSHFARES